MDCGLSSLYFFICFENKLVRKVCLKMGLNFVLLIFFISFLAGGNGEDLELKMANVVSFLSNFGGNIKVYIHLDIFIVRVQ